MTNLTTATKPLVTIIIAVSTMVAVLLVSNVNHVESKLTRTAAKLVNSEGRLTDDEIYQMTHDPNYYFDNKTYSGPVDPISGLHPFPDNPPTYVPDINTTGSSTTPGTTTDSTTTEPSNINLAGPVPIHPGSLDLPVSQFYVDGTLYKIDSAEIHNAAFINDAGNITTLTMAGGPSQQLVGGLDMVNHGFFHDHIDVTGSTIDAIPAGAQIDLNGLGPWLGNAQVDVDGHDYQTLILLGFPIDLSGV